jgi:hypothetical protein
MAVITIPLARVSLVVIKVDADAQAARLLLQFSIGPGEGKLVCHGLDLVEGAALGHPVAWELLQIIERLKLELPHGVLMRRLPG